MTYDPLPRDVETIAKETVNCALKVHRSLGPGLLESVYEVCLAHELNKLSFVVEQQIKLPVLYDGKVLEAGMRLDLWIERQLIVEVKTVENLLPVHSAQLLTYLKLTNNRLGLLINFNVALIKTGIKRIIL
jgi:GxxExxY protein